MNRYERTKFVLDQHAGELTPVHRLLVEAVFNRLDRLIEQNDELLARGRPSMDGMERGEIRIHPDTDPLTEMSESLRGKPDETVYETKRKPTDTERLDALGGEIWSFESSMDSLTSSSAEAVIRSIGLSVVFSNLPTLADASTLRAVADAIIERDRKG